MSCLEKKMHYPIHLPELRIAIPTLVGQLLELKPNAKCRLSSQKNACFVVPVPNGSERVRSKWI